VKLKRPGPEADYSPPSTAKVKRGGAVSPLPMYLHGLVRNSVNTGKTLNLQTHRGGKEGRFCTVNCTSDYHFYWSSSPCGLRCFAILSKDYVAKSSLSYGMYHR
jgi:hypothetical protein